LTYIVFYVTVLLLFPPGSKLLRLTILWRLVRKQTFGSVLPLLHSSSVHLHFLCAYGFSWKCLFLLW